MPWHAFMRVLINLKKNKYMIKKIKILAVLAMMSAMPVLASASTITSYMQLGSRGTDVTTLQTYLATDRTIYPQGLVTGYFGGLTQSAVSNFQERNGIDNTIGNGRVGPATLAVLNAKMNGTSVNTGDMAPMISAVGVNASSNSANVVWNTNEAAKGTVYYSTTPLVTYENTNSVNVSGSVAMTDGNLHVSQNVSLQNLQNNTTYYYMIYTTDASGYVSVTWPATFHTNN
jgi:peptidoglycan hydrolase-like protein with peptidoglycan-binding domain